MSKPETNKIDTRGYMKPRPSPLLTLITLSLLFSSGWRFITSSQPASAQEKEPVSSAKDHINTILTFLQDKVACKKRAMACGKDVTVRPSRPHLFAEFFVDFEKPRKTIITNEVNSELCAVRYFPNEKRIAITVGERPDTPITVKYNQGPARIWMGC